MAWKIKLNHTECPFRYKFGNQRADCDIVDAACMERKCPYKIKKKQNLNK